MDGYYALKVSFHPDPKVEHKMQFSTREEAQEHIEAFGNGGGYWLIIRESDNSYVFIKGFNYQRS